MLIDYLKTVYKTGKIRDEILQMLEEKEIITESDLELIKGDIKHE